MNRNPPLTPVSPAQPPNVRHGPTLFMHEDDHQSGLGEVARKLWRRKWIVLGVTAAFAAIGSIAPALMTPLYTAESQVLIGTQTPHVLNVQSVLAGLNADTETVQSEVYIVTSRATAEKVARKLALDESPEFNAALRPKPAFDLSRFLGIDAIKSWLTPPAKSSSGPSDPQAAEARKWDRVITSLLGHVYVTPLNRSHVLNISVESENPQMASRIANAFAGVYLEQQLDAKQTATGKADQWLEDRIAKVKQQVQTSEQAVEDYRREHQLYETKSDTVIAQQLSELNRELLVAQNAKVDADTRYQQAKSHIEKADSMESLPVVLNSPLIQTLRAQQAQLEQKSAEIGSTYTSKHPLRRDIAAQINEVRTKIRAEAERIVGGLNHQVNMADDRLQRVKQQMAELQNRVGEANEESVKLRQLEREAQANRDILVELLRRWQETIGQQSLQVADARVISPASTPLSPSFPPSKLILILSIFVGAGGGVLLALLMEGIDRTFHTREEVEAETGMPVLSLVPATSERRRAPTNLQTPYWESIQMLNTQLSLETSTGNAPRSVMFTSAVPFEGKTNLSTSYARLLAKEGQRVVFLELDWKRPSLHKVLGQRQRAGLAELLHGLVTPEEAVYRDPATGLHAIFAGNQRYISQSHIWLARLRLLLATLSRHYDVIVLDTAPASATPEILHAARLIERTVFVVKWGATPRGLVLSELGKLARSGANFAGIVLSQVDLRRYRRYAYDEGDYYHHHRGRLIFDT